MWSLSHIVYIVPETFKKKTLPNSLLHRITIIEYTVEKNCCQPLHWIRQERLRKQIIFSVNRLGHAQLKENQEKKMALMKLEDIFQHEHATAKKLCIENI